MVVAGIEMIFSAAFVNSVTAWMGLSKEERVQQVQMWSHVSPLNDIGYPVDLTAKGRGEVDIDLGIFDRDVRSTAGTLPKSQHQRHCGR